MSKTFKISIATLVVVVVGIGAWVRFDEWSVNARRRKVADMNRIAARLQKSHMSAVLAELGSPSRVQLQAIEDRGGGAVPSQQLVFTYEYAFGAIPWKHKQRVWLTFRFDQNMQSTVAWVDQTFG